MSEKPESGRPTRKVKVIRQHESSWPLTAFLISIVIGVVTCAGIKATPDIIRARQCLPEKGD